MRPQAERAGAEEVLTNDSVVHMVRAGLPEGVMRAKIRSTPAKFDLRIDAQVALKQAGVSPKVIRSEDRIDVEAEKDSQGWYRLKP